ARRVGSKGMVVEAWQSHVPPPLGGIAMPRPKGIPAYGLHKPTGQARVRIDGKDVYLGPHGSEESRRKYEQIVRKMITDRAAQEVRARVEIASDLTISELVVGYTRHAKAYYVNDGPQTPDFA